MAEGRPVETSWERKIAGLVALVEEKHAAHQRLGLPRVDVTLGALRRLDRLFLEHAEPGDEWCRKCRDEAPCAEVRAAETLFWVIEKTETEGLEKGAG